MNITAISFSKVLRLGLLLSTASLLLSGCATSSGNPTWPVENSGSPQFQGTIPPSSSILIVPSVATSNACMSKPDACQIFVNSLSQTVSQSGKALAISHPRHFSVPYEKTIELDELVKQHSVQYVLIWEVGVLDEVRPYSFQSHTFSVSGIRVEDAITSEVVLQQSKPYGLLGMNIHAFNTLPAEAGSRLGRALASRVSY